MVGLLRLGCFDGEVGGGGFMRGWGFERVLGGAGGVVRHKCSDISPIFSRFKRIVSRGRSIIVYISPTVHLPKKKPPPRTCDNPGGSTYFYILSIYVRYVYIGDLIERTYIL